MIGDIVPIDGWDGSPRSASASDAPGFIAISLPSTPLGLAELIVLESAAQYFNLAKALGPIDDGTDDALFPTILRGRPIERMLRAQHGLVNVIAFLGRVARTCPDLRVPAEIKIARQQKALDEVERGLERTNALTEIGRAIWRPLGRS